MTTSFSRPLKPETMDQVTSSRDALPRWGTAFSERQRREVRCRCLMKGRQVERRITYGPASASDPMLPHDPS